MTMDWGANPSAAGGSSSPAPSPALDALEAAVGMLQELDPGLADAVTLGHEVARLEAVSSRITSQIVARLAVMEARGDAHTLGFRSVQAWLRSMVRLAPGAAKGLAALARRIGTCEATAESLESGLISLPHAQIVARTMAEISPSMPDPAEVAKVEANLVEIAEHTDPLRLANACRRLRIQVAPERAGTEDWNAFELRDLSVAQTFGGLGVINGTLDPLGAETVMAAIHAFAGPAGEDDRRTPGQRRADALTEICHRVLTIGEAPTNGGERPHVSVIVPLATLEERVSAEPGGLAWAGPISPELVRRLLCDAAVHRIVVDGASQPLDVGRTTRVVPSGLRRAVMIRDLHCQWPGCDVPAVWCDCHHIKEWSRGGPTAIHNLIMLCGYHHSRLHLSRRVIVRHADGRVELIPDPDHHRDQDTDRGP